MADSRGSYDDPVRLWLSRYGRRRLHLWAPVLLIALFSLAAALLLWTRINRGGTPSERIDRLADMGELDKAEQLSWESLQKKPNDLDAWIRFIDMHAALRPHSGDENFVPATFRESTVSEQSIRQMLGRISDRQISTLASYWYEMRATGGKPDTSSVSTLADTQTPARHANYLLARTAMENDDWAAAARHLEREGLAFPEERERHLRRAIMIWIDHEAWDEVQRLALDPRFAGVLDARFRLELAIHSRDWPGMLRWLWPAGVAGREPWPVFLAVLAAVLWFVIAGRLGRIGDSRGRPLLYALSFILGILSIYPTLLLILIEEDMFGFQAMGQPLPDAIYYVFGVGLREELCKLLLFLPLVPVLVRRGSRLEAMTCAALVGLGFAAEENINYFHMGDAGMAVGRFLTANFLHMSLTALVGLSVYDTARSRSTSRDGFSSIFPLAVLLHGVYDFFLSSEQFAGLSFISMALFVILAQQFLRQLLVASSAAEQEGVLRLLVWSMALLTGVSYVYATSLAGPWIALRLISLGLLGVAIVIYMFVRELGT